MDKLKSHILDKIPPFGRDFFIVFAGAGEHLNALPGHLFVL